jgi:hypothetical protein
MRTRNFIYEGEELTYVDFYHYDFHRCDALVLILYGDIIISIRYPKQLMMGCSESVYTMFEVLHEKWVRGVCSIPDGPRWIGTWEVVPHGFAQRR